MSIFSRVLSSKFLFSIAVVFSLQRLLCSALLSIVERTNVSVIIPCQNISSHETIHQVEWKGPNFDSVIVLRDKEIKNDRFVFGMEDLKIFQTIRNDSGLYSCTVVAVNQTYNRTANLLIQDPPDAPTDFKLRALLNGSIVVSFAYNKNSFIRRLEVTLYTGQWKRSVNVLRPFPEALFSKLIPYTPYSARVRAYDELGPGEYSSPKFQCTQRGKPSGIPELHVVNVSSTSIALLANINATGLQAELSGNSTCPGSYRPYTTLSGPMEGYTLHLVERDSPNSTIIHHHRTNVIDEQVIVLHSLKPFTNYTIRAALNNGHTDGPKTQIATKTTESLPKPPKLILNALTDSSFSIRWLPCTNESGVILGYKVEYEGDNIDSPIVTEQSETSFASKSTLEPSTSYKVRIACKTGAGFGEFSDYMKLQTRPLPPPQPVLLNVDPIEGKGVIVNWTNSLNASVPDKEVQYSVCVLPVSEERAMMSCHTTHNQGTTFPLHCYCNETYPYHWTLMSWESIYRLSSRRLSFSVRTCATANNCNIVSNFSNSIEIDLAALEAKHNFLSLDDKAIGSIVATVAFIIFSVIIVIWLSWHVQCAYKGYEVTGLGTDSGECNGGPKRPTMLTFEESSHKAIPVSALAEHVANCHADDDAGYQAEFEAIERTVSTNWPTLIARLPDNMPKNRYSNVFSYDHTRVILKNPHGRKSDYINANYVDGYHRQQAYIAAQGPLSTTFDDFWQMVWDENSNIIVMISNFVERGRRKCDQYWPSEGQQAYGNIMVRMVSQNVLACFIVRLFSVKNSKCKKFTKDRIVYHYQYTDWRDFDVPPSPLPVLVFVKSTIQHWLQGSGPIIVHCSAGVGRTGTYICIESLIRQINIEKQVNVRGFLEHIRQHRMKLVQTEQQYAFIHDALREYLLCPEHEVQASDLATYIRCLRESEDCGCTRLERQFEICTEWRPQEYDYFESRKPCNSDKNRSDILPTESRRVALPSEPGVDGSSYINASRVQGFRNLYEFIVTQNPLKETEADFWRMVWDENSALVIVLSSEDLPPFWPMDTQECRNIGSLRVGYCGSETFGSSSTCYEYLLSSGREDYALSCRLWRLHKWPENVTDLATIELLKMEADLVSFTRSYSAGPIIIVDDCGGSRAGIFCSINFLVNQLSMLGALDVYYIFKMFHLQRAGIFATSADLEFVYEVMEQYVAGRNREDGIDQSTSNYVNLGVGIFGGGPGSPSIINNRFFNHGQGTMSSSPMISAASPTDEVVGDLTGGLRSSSLVSYQGKDQLCDLNSVSSRTSLGTTADCNLTIAAVHTSPSCNKNGTRPLSNGGFVHSGHSLRRVPLQQCDGIPSALMTPLSLEDLPPPPNQSPPPVPSSFTSETSPSSVLSTNSVSEAQSSTQLAGCASDDAQFSTLADHMSASDAKLASRRPIDCSDMVFFCNPKTPTTIHTPASGGMSVSFHPVIGSTVNGQHFSRGPDHLRSLSSLALAKKSGEDDFYQNHHTSSDISTPTQMDVSQRTIELTCDEVSGASQNGVGCSPLVTDPTTQGYLSAKRSGRAGGSPPVAPLLNGDINKEVMALLQDDKLGDSYFIA